jgi:hypothetical protein
MGSDESKPCIPPATLPTCSPRTGLLYALSTFYLLLALLIIIMAFAIPGLATTPEIAFAVVGVLLFAAALFQIISVGRLARPAPCPRP